MQSNPRRRELIKVVGGLGVAASGVLSFPAIAQNRPIKIGIIAPKGGIDGTIGECGLRGTQFAADKFNAAGGIAGRKVELIVEEETNPKDSIERLRKLVLQDKVDCMQGIVSSGVSLAMGPSVEELKTVTIYWDGTTQDGVRETMPKPRYLFRSTDNECEAVMASLLAIKHFKGKFATIAGINPDYSYGRNNWASFLALLKLFGVQVKMMAEQWPKVGTLDLSSHVAALKAAKPDLIFSSLLFANLPVFMQTAYSAGLMAGDTKFVLPAAGFQHTLLKKEFTPDGMIFGHNTLYFDLPNASPIQKEFVQMYADRYKDYPHWEADRAYFAMQVYKADDG
ncbi:MAG: ABC transporter substrate-binding protein [Candidatus Protistobacter heckmanni]|nr:ABC transporter substrate-binding protein [Candidatus Protistobacter heckmanni]